MAEDLNATAHMLLTYFIVAIPLTIVALLAGRWGSPVVEFVPIVARNA
jgi:hypothetical protein